MTIAGIENDYYLAQNDIWVTVSNDNIDYLTLKTTNTSTGGTLSEIKMFASPDKKVRFNISLVVRALFPEFNPNNINTLQEFTFVFTSHYGTTIEEQTSYKKFIRGGRYKNGNDEWYLSPTEELIIKPWIEFIGLPINTPANRIQGSTVIDFLPTEKFQKTIGCDYKIVKFLNSLGGIQYYVFDKYEYRNKSKHGRLIDKVADRLRNDNFRQAPTEIEKSIRLFTKTPAECQPIIFDLIESTNVYLYNPAGTDNNARWERLIIEDNDCLYNNYDRVYENNLEFSIGKYKTQW